MGLGYGSWNILATARGGDDPFLDIPFTSLSYSLQVDQATSFRIELAPEAGTTCCEVFDELEYWRDEVAIYRDGVLVACGPIIRLDLGKNGLSIDARDLSYWGDKRWIERDITITGDPAGIFTTVFDIAMEVDDSPNIECVTRDVGIPVTREYAGGQKQRAGDAWRELGSGTLLDYITIGRTIYAGDLQAFFGTDAFIVHTEGVLDISASKDGEKFATDLAVLGAIPNREQFPAQGRAQRSGEYWGVLQESVTDLNVYDNLAADESAEARLGAQYPFPVSYKVTFGPDTEVEFDRLVPGRFGDLKVARTNGCIQVNEVMLLESVSVNVREDDETITGDFVPLGDLSAS